MVTVEAFEAKPHFAQLLERAQRGEAIMRRGRAVARLVPATATPDPEIALAAFRRLRERAKRAGVGKLDWSEWRSHVEQGRP